MARIVSLGSALQDVYLIDHDDLAPTSIGAESIFGKVLVGSKVDIDRISYICFITKKLYLSLLLLQQKSRKISPLWYLLFLLLRKLRLKRLKLLSRPNQPLIPHIQMRLLPEQNPAASRLPLKQTVSTIQIILATTITELAPTKIPYLLLQRPKLPLHRKILMPLLRSVSIGG